MVRFEVRIRFTFDVYYAFTKPTAFLSCITVMLLARDGQIRFQI